MNKRTFIVTGGNSGIGKAAALALAKQGEQVVIVSRNACKGEAALAEVRSLSGNPGTELVVGDLGSVESTKHLAADLLARFPGIVVLINNAGVWPTSLQLNAEGLENAFMVNHLAPYILSRMLYPQLRQNAPSRIVNVNAGLYIKGKVDLSRTPYGKDFGRFSTYMNTKLCNIYCTQSFAKLLDGTGVTVNAIHPGVIRTNLGDTGGLFGWLLRQAKRSWGTPEEGARPVVRLGTAPELEQTNGKYFDLLAEKSYAENAQDDDLREKLWKLSGKLAGC
jgi:NAD(P)-dependent dehydrogenase (short-subunit alcohol dehydrogenase family)